jgi:hypothetical protein
MSKVIAVLGGNDVGKTSFCKTKYIPSLVEDTYIVDRVSIVLVEYKEDMDIVYDGVIFIHDLTDNTTLTDPGLPRFLKESRDRCPNIPIVIFGNKNDIVSGMTTNWIVEKMIPKDIDCFYGSCKTGDNIYRCIHTLVSKISSESWIYKYIKLYYSIHFKL